MKTITINQMDLAGQPTSPARAPRILAEFAAALRCDSYASTTWGTTATANVTPFVNTVEPSRISVANLDGAKPHNQRPEEKYS